MNRAQRAQQLWPLLAFAARNRQILFYGEIAKVCGVPAAAVGQNLEPIQRYCAEKALPPLTSIVVNRETGLPGTGFTAAADVPGAQVRTFLFDWFGIEAPSETDLKD